MMVENKFHSVKETEKMFAANHLNESEETRNRCVEEIRQWYLKDVGPNAFVDNNTILWFLRTCKFNIERTKANITHFYLTRYAYPEYFSNLNPFLPELEVLLKKGIICGVSNADRNGCWVIVVRPFVYDTHVSTLTQYYKTMFMVADVALKHEIRSSMFGSELIIDMVGMSGSHMLQYTPNVLTFLSIAAQNFYPVRVKGFHFINVPWFFNMVLKVFKNMIKTKMLERIHVHRNGLQDLLEFFPISAIPVDYGGTAESLSTLTNYMEKTVKSHKEWLEKMEAAGSTWAKCYYKQH